MADFAKFELTVTPVSNHGGSKVVVNEVDITSQTKAIALFAQAGHPTTLQVHTYAEGVVTGEGIVEIHVEGKDGIAAWLRQVNRASVDARALNRGGWGDDSTLTDNVIETLLEMLDENKPSSDT